MIPRWSVPMKMFPMNTPTNTTWAKRSSSVITLIYDLASFLDPELTQPPKVKTEEIEPTQQPPVPQPVRTEEKDTFVPPSPPRTIRITPLRRRKSIHKPSPVPVSSISPALAANMREDPQKALFDVAQALFTKITNKLRNNQALDHADLMTVVDYAYLNMFTDELERYE